MTDVFEIDALCNWSYVLLGGIYALAALIFYAFRIWKVSADWVSRAKVKVDSVRLTR